jgi:hypothetical protein
MTSQAVGALVDAMAGAAQTLSHLSRKATSQAIRLAAARAVLEIAQRLTQSIELEERITALEKRQTERKIA